MFKLTLALMFVFSSCAQLASEQPKLWAGISVQKPVFEQTETAKLVIFFAVVNDSTSTANPDVESSHLLVNGVEPENWSITIHNGLRSRDFCSLPPGHTLLFTYGLGTLFTKPGTYTVRWESVNFKSADMVFRVVPNSN